MALSAPQAESKILLMSQEGWEVSFDGAANAFVMKQSADDTVADGVGASDVATFQSEGGIMSAGTDEVGIVAGLTGDLTSELTIGQEIVKIDHRYFRPSEVETLLGDASKAKEELGWEALITAKEMCKEMVEEDLKDASRLALLKAHNLELPISVEN